MKRLSMVSTIIGATPLCAAPISLSPTKQLGVSLDAAQAPIGRPLTPFSIAGVNRRMNRRAYYGGYYGYHHPYAYGYHRPYYAYAYHHPYHAYGYHHPYRAYGYHPHY